MISYHSLFNFYIILCISCNLVLGYIPFPKIAPCNNDVINKFNNFKINHNNINYSRFFNKESNSCSSSCSSSTSSSTSLFLSLDEPLLPRQGPQWKLYFLSYLCLRIFIRLMNIIIENVDVDYINETYFETLPVNLNNITKRINLLLTPIRNKISDLLYKFNLDIFPKFNFYIHVITAKVKLIMEQLWENIDSALDLDPPDIVNLKEWGVCVLSQKELLPGGYFRYRFEIDSSNAVLPLQLGQEISMCSVDNKEKVLKEAFFPVSSPLARGYFDIMTKIGGESASDRFARSLSELLLGDEIAYKGGRYRLNYLGSNYPIKAVSIVASGLGATSALQILQNVLPGDSTTIENVEMVWINENEEDYICTDKIRQYEYGHLEKFTLDRIIEDDLYGRGFTRKDEIKQTLSSFDKGRIAIICAPEYVVGKARNFLTTELGYPLDDIVTIVTSS